MSHSTGKTLFGIIVLVALIVAGVYLYKHHEDKEKSNTASALLPQYSPHKTASLYNGRVVEPAAQTSTSVYDQHSAPQSSYYARDTGNKAAAYDASYPVADEPSSQFPTAANAGVSQTQGYKLDIDSLMPASWKGGDCKTDQKDTTQWTRYAPTKEAFDHYITAAGSARLSMNTRSPLGRQTGIPLLLRQGPPVPLSTEQVPFHDSSFRQDLVYRQTGRFPESTSC